MRVPDRLDFPNPGDDISMKKNLVTFAAIGFALFGMFPLRGADATGVIQWSAAQLTTTLKDLATKIDQTGSGTEQLLKEKSYGVVLVHREGTGQGEIHEN